MIKEMLICAIIIIVILVGNGITQGYSQKSIEAINQELASLEEIIDKKLEEDSTDVEEIKQKEEEIYANWEKMFSRLAYYIEHEELEKVSRNLENIKTYIKLQQYEETVKEINEVIFVLNHIEEKYSFNLQNIF